MGKHHGGGGGFKSGGSSFKSSSSSSKSYKSSSSSFKSTSKPYKSPSHSNTSHKSHAAKHHYTPSYGSSSHSSSHSSHGSHASHASHRPHHVSHFQGEGPGLLESLWEFLFGERTPEPEPAMEALRPPEPLAPPPTAQTDPRVEALRGMHRVPMTTVDWRVYRDAPDPGGEGSRAWAQTRDIATRVLAGDTLAYQEALALCGCLVSVHEHVGRDGIRVALRERDGHVDVRAPLGTQVGQVVQTPSERLDLYQDYVCGLSLRIARELLAVLPIESVTVDLWNVTAAAPPMADGAFRQAETPATNVRIASMRCDRNALAPVPWQAVDASQLVESLPHQMRFVPTEGFHEVGHVG